MKVILLKDIQSVGRKFDVKEVADGHAMNFLFPRKLAEMATDKSLKRIEQMKNQNAADIKVQEKSAFEEFTVNTRYYNNN